ncbi:GreA/GreB family elongation factor [Orenia marismortui]|uniref:GreA/GreB family elongation factor n=1 Tax=Orenia marismortui TaxID=46469 RepID=UPI00036C6944|nr:GreA/GreB family elongation factor [Orenia marismortui]
MVDKVELGCKVKLKDLIIELEHDYRIVDENMQDIKNQNFSYKSPFGQAVLGARKGEIVEVKSEAGIIKYKVLDIFER